MSVANSPAFSQPGKPPESSFIFNEGVRRTQPTPFVPEWPAVNARVEPMLNRLFDLDVLLEDIDTTSQAVLAPEEE